MKSKLTALALLIYVFTNAQPVDFKLAPNIPGSNYYSVVKEWREYLNLKESAFKSANPNSTRLPDGLREEIAQFERWAYNWQDRVSRKGFFPNDAQGWINIINTEYNTRNARTTSGVTWTSLGPTDSAISNGWTYGAGIGRINVVRKHPTQPILFAGSAAGGIFKSTNMGDSWLPVTDNFAGLGISDIVINPANPNIMYAATGDWDASHMSSIGVIKSTDGGNTWVLTGLIFNLNQSYRIAHLAIDPADPNIIYATGKDYIHRTTDAGATWTNYYAPGTNFFFNDIVKIGSNWFVSDKTGVIYKSNPAMTDASNSFLEVYNNNRNERLDFAWTPANPDTLYLLSQTNPAFSKFSIQTNAAIAYANVTNSTNSADNNANFNTQSGYNQVIVVSPTNKDSVWVGEFSGGKLSADGGVTWQNKLNGYYDPNDNNTNWGGFYVHSDQHDFAFLGSDTLLIGNDGGVYLGKISTNSFSQKFNGLVTTQSYSIAINDDQPGNLLTGNQDNDGSSRIFESGVGKYYGGQAGDGTGTALSPSDHLVRYLGGTNGSLSYRTDGYKTHWSGNSITKPNDGPFVWDLHAHTTNGTILYGGFSDLYKMTVAPTGTWTALGTGLPASAKVRKITLANNNSTTQKIIVIGTDNTIRKSIDETNWTTITPPAGVVLNSIYAKKNNFDSLFATASGYDAANKIFFSTDQGTTWQPITRNFPNVVTKKILAYEGTDTLLVATEVGVYYARLSELLNVAVANPWSLYGSGMPRVRVEDMEISYAKKQLVAGSFGRGVWVASLATQSALPLHNINFSYVKINSGYSFKWTVTDDDVITTVFEKSSDGINFKVIDNFSGQERLKQPGYRVPLSENTTYYRLYYTKSQGQKSYSQVIVIRKAGVNSVVTVYPNPTTGNIFISSDNKMNYVRIFTLNGQQMSFAQPNLNSYAFDLSLLPKGTYIIRIDDEKGNSFFEKVVRQ